MSDKKIYTDSRGRQWVEDPNGTAGWWSVEPGGPAFTRGVETKFRPDPYYPPELKHGDRSSFVCANGREVYRRYRLLEPKEAPKVEQKGNGCPHCAGDGWVYTSSLSGPERDGCPADCRGDPIVEVAVNVYEAAARIVRATIARELTEDEARRLRGFTDTGAFQASWGALK